MGIARRLAQDSSGQMTIELAAVLPVALTIAFLAVNALTFFGQCAVFDRVAHDAVRIHAASPAYKQGAAQSCALVEADILAALGSKNVNVSVTYSPVAYDLDCYTATLEVSPTLFGMGMRSQVFGVSMPRLVHSTEYVVDSYRAGVII